MPAAILNMMMRWDPQQKLLEIAKGYLDDGKPAGFQAAVVFSQMACEVSTEAAFTSIIKKRNLDFLQDAFDELVPNYNLGNSRVRKLYVSLFGDQIQDARFWPQLQKHVERRNKVIHEGKEVRREEAEASLEVANNLITHLRERLR